jgi:DNA-binding MarR family transcriptional regulator
VTATVDRGAVPITGLLGMAYNGLSAVIFERVVASGSDDIRPSHGNVFEQLTFEDGLRLKDLAARAQMTPQAMGELVDELEGLGYVERRPDPNDRRAKRICLTRRGKRNTLRGLEIVTELENELEEMLGPRRLRSLRATLLEILDSPLLS